MCLFIMSCTQDAVQVGVIYKYVDDLREKTLRII